MTGLEWKHSFAYAQSRYSSLELIRNIVWMCNENILLQASRNYNICNKEILGSNKGDHDWPDKYFNRKGSEPGKPDINIGLVYKTE